MWDVERKAIQVFIHSNSGDFSRCGSHASYIFDIPNYIIKFGKFRGKLPEKQNCNLNK